MEMTKSRKASNTKIKSDKIRIFYISPYDSKTNTSRNYVHSFKYKSKSFFHIEPPKCPISPLVSKQNCPDISSKSSRSNIKEKISKNNSYNKINEIKEIRKVNNSENNTKFIKKKYLKSIPTPNKNFILRNKNSKKFIIKVKNIFEFSSDKVNKYSTEPLCLKKQKNYNKKRSKDLSNIKTTNSQIYKSFSNEINFQDKKIKQRKKDMTNPKSHSSNKHKKYKSSVINENKIGKQKKSKSIVIKCTNNHQQEQKINKVKSKSELCKEIDELFFQNDFNFQARINTNYEKYRKIITFDKKKSNKNEKICDMKISPFDLNIAKTIEYNDHDTKKKIKTKINYI